MSGIQSTVTDRTGSILTKDHPPDKQARSDKAAVLSPQEFDPTGLVQRCVIIQKDENGFGLTVSGDNPVFVQLVKEDGAAMRAGVQTGDRIIKVNGTLVTHSNHVEVVKLIKSGSYVALTVLGRPPGLPQIPLSEEEGDAGLLNPGGSSLTSPNSPGQTAGDRTSNPLDHDTPPRPVWAMKEEPSRNPKLLKETQEAKKHLLGVQDGLLLSEVEEGGAVESDPVPAAGGDGSVDGVCRSSTAPPATRNLSESSGAAPETLCQREVSGASPKATPRDSLACCPSPEAEDTPELDSQSSVGSPASLPAPQIIGAEDDYFDTEQEQVNGQCSCFQSIELLKSRPAHLAVFLHHVVSQFDPAPLLCFLYAELYKQAGSKDTRRIFMDLHSFFMDRAANLKVAVPESVSSELERRRPELLPEEMHRQYVHVLQEALLSDIHRNLEDFRQKRSMGLTLADGELARLDSERVRDRGVLERERVCAENIISRIEDVLLSSSSAEEEKCTTMQYVILAYMKFLGVRVKEPRGLEPKRVRINFLPRMKKKPEREGEERVKKPRFPSIRVPPRLSGRTEATPVGKASEQAGKQRPPKQLPQPGLSLPAEDPTRTRGSQSSEGSEPTPTPAPTTSPPHCSLGLSSEGGARDVEPGLTPSSALPRLTEGPNSADSIEGGAKIPSMHFDFSPYSLEQLPEEERENDRVLEGGTPKAGRRADALGSAEVQSEDDQASERDSEQDPPNWQQLVGRSVLASLTPQQIKRQEVINELFYTERAHLRMLRVLDNVFYQKLTKDAVLPPADIKNIFTNLEEIVLLHGSISEQMTAIRKKNESSVIDQIGDDLLSWFSGGEEEKIKRAVSTFCSNQPFALELIKTRQKKDSRFAAFIQEAESNRLCRRLQLKDIIPVEMQRLTKYPLLLENIAKYTEDAEERGKVKKAGECCRKILNHVNQAVKESENKQRLEDYQRRLDLSSLKQSENPMISEFKNLDLTKRKMVHEGPLSWKVNKDKTIELYTLLLEDILVLMQKQDDRLVLRCHSKNLAGSSDTKHIYSPVIKLSTVLVRSVATDNKSFFVLSMSDNGAQIYELMAQTVSEQRTWQCLITQRADSMKSKQHNVIPLPQPHGERETVEMKLCKDPDRTLTASAQSPGDLPAHQHNRCCVSAHTHKDAMVASPSTLPNTLAASTPFQEEEEEAAFQEQEGDEGPFLDSDLADRLPFLKQRSRQAVAIDDDESNSFVLPPSRAEEALKALAALKQVLVSQMMSQEEGESEGQSPGGRLQRTASLRDSVDSAPRVAMAPGSAENGTGRSQAGREEGGQEPSSGDCEDYGYLVLEGCGGSGESSTDEEQGAPRGAAGDAHIDLKRLLSSAAQPGGTPSFSRQVLTHLRIIQANLQHLKDVETKYNELRQRHAGPAADSEESRDKS
ncbi:rho guanine nucleotide exchange factor 12-like isoform X2 [Megalops cyprinoides]|uniref:rho guanine nucleotide exchange factor 12-like isoform X2 n=1 Tax=Megalops cyprinoides TaxID=118141 RepID=UPI001864A961|nr:rho guanine nucleotide exchange factor 12-like isoform X2 [Megalops cyprinoides]